LNLLRHRIHTIAIAILLQPTNANQSNGNSSPMLEFEWKRKACFGGNQQPAIQWPAMYY
jgi:hypothetical protein